MRTFIFINLIVALVATPQITPELVKGFHEPGGQKRIAEAANKLAAKHIAIAKAQAHVIAAKAKAKQEAKRQQNAKKGAKADQGEEQHGEGKGAKKKNGKNNHAGPAAKDPKAKEDENKPKEEEKNTEAPAGN